MAKIDKIKEKISLYKFFLGIITGMILSIIGFIFANYQNLKVSLIVISIISIIVLIYIFALLLSLIIKNIDELENL